MNKIQLKKSKAVEVGEHVLTPQHPTGILLAHKVKKVESVDKGERIELTTDEITRGRIHVLGVEDVVAVV